MPENKRLKTGLLQVYTGTGKGKTTAAVGLAMRAAGHGFKVLVIQFMKGRLYGELNSASHVPGLTIEQYGRDEFVKKGDPDPIDVEFAQKGLARACEAVAGCEYDIVVLDEINVALDFGLLPWDAVREVIEKRPTHVEVVCTGRNAPQPLLDMADLLTEMKEIRHPFQKKIDGRKGIEF